MDSSTKKTISKTALFDLHNELGAKMVDFAGYKMPVQYNKGLYSGIIKEHINTRQYAGLFDVSHMGQLIISGDDPISSFEKLVPADLKALSLGEQCYTQMTNSNGGIIDDLIITRTINEIAKDCLYIVVNASRKSCDHKHIREVIGNEVEIKILSNRGLIALQGPMAETVLLNLIYAQSDKRKIQELTFFNQTVVTICGIECWVSACGYTGESGFEISALNKDIEKIATLILNDDRVSPVGLGARDSLRLEAGLCLYGNDLNEEITPIEASLIWSVGKRRRVEGGFLGYDVIKEQITNGVNKKFVGLSLEGRIPCRKGAIITDLDGNEIGEVSSGGFSPNLKHPIAMGFVDSKMSKAETEVKILIRNKIALAKIVKLPFVKHNYKKA